MTNPTFNRAFVEYEAATYDEAFEKFCDDNDLDPCDQATHDAYDEAMRDAEDEWVASQV